MFSVILAAAAATRPNPWVQLLPFLVINAGIFGTIIVVRLIWRRRKRLAAEYIRCSCPHCGQHYELGWDFLGKKAFCEQCGKEFTVSVPGVSAAGCAHCPDCGGIVSRRASTCPHCGRPFDPISIGAVGGVLWCLILFPIALIALLVFFGGNLFAAVMLISAAIWLQTLTWAMMK